MVHDGNGAYDFAGSLGLAREIRRVADHHFRLHTPPNIHYAKKEKRKRKEKKKEKKRRGKRRHVPVNGARQRRDEEKTTYLGNSVFSFHSNANALRNKNKQKKTDEQIKLLGVRDPVFPTYSVALTPNTGIVVHQFVNVPIWKQTMLNFIEISLII
jgi:hypothetical protein